VVLDLNAQIAATFRLFSTLIGEHVTVDFRPATGLWPVLCDPSQIDQVLLNLVVNARDAMPRGGTITLTTANVTLDPASQLEVPGASPGPYVTLSVQDEGVGIEPKILPRIFEPFFTTKRVDKGTGLGLATVYGIVQQNGWFIDVDSEPGRGATFRLYMAPATGDAARSAPRGDGAHGPAPPHRRRSRPHARDDPARRGRRDGAQPHERPARFAGLHGAGVGVAGRGDCPPGRRRTWCRTLLLTDVVMPQMTGPELRERLTETMPGLKTILMSGYTSHSAVRQALADEHVRFIQKPFTKLELEQAIRELLSS
jgi:CheY-like chemotaxis protein